MNLAQVTLIASIGNSALLGERVAISLYALDRGASAFALGVLLAIFSIGPMAIAIPAGRWIDRVGPIVPLRAAFVLLIVALLVPVASSSYIALAGASVCAGSAGCTMSIALNNATGSIAGGEGRARNFTWLAMGLSSGNAFGPLIAGFVIDGASFRAAFLALAAVGIVALSLALVQKIGTRSERPAKSSAGGGFDLLRHPQLWPVFTAALLSGLSWELFQFSVPLLGTEKSIPASQIGIIVALFALTAVAVRSVLPFLARRLSEWQLYSICCAVTATGMAVLPLGTGAFSLGAMAVLIGAGFSFMIPLMMAVTWSLAPAGRQGEAAALRFWVVNLCSVTYPPVFGALAEITGVSLVVWIGSTGLAAGAWFSYSRHRAARNAGMATP